MYENPGYSVFDWRSQEGTDGSKGHLDKLRIEHNSWKQQQDQAEALRRKQELDAARQRAEQYLSAVGPSYYQPAQEQSQSASDIYKPAGLDEGAGYDYAGGSFSPGAY